MTTTRTYNSPLREDQMELTRERILQTATDMMAEGADEITVATVAERAKVSVRTAYRYFPTKEALLDGLNEWMGKQMGSPPIPTSFEDMAIAMTQLFEMFDKNEKLIRASRNSKTGNEVRLRRKAEQLKATTKLIMKYAPHYDEAQAKKVCAICLMMFGSDAWLAMRDLLHLNNQEATEAVRWGFDALLAKIETDRPRKGRK
jgi:AcrR family transcriptional regulator